MNPVAVGGLSLALLLAACGSEADVARESGDAKEAEGEILGGAISDDMLPLDKLKSQSPPLKQELAAGGDAAPASEGEDTDAAEDAPAEDAESDPDAEAPADEG
ncbi:hypothetical protein P7228_03630 [Altererythrobacter arenosus]|uniref:Uncharacterized protein n=1 Tax=Altererythrobacter arenosus TaxID=3032592 RepID=A0ABY8G181_9SPHN|nr:hypothetical protein [Altererythrobacter sp. CAU 1644]WFL78169.1 hypothetical protein P7228_03630 [Altererythrobacter sp. CAU 1644]